MKTASKKPALSKLEALQAKMKQIKLGGGNQGFWSPPEGTSIIRILPEVGGMEFFFTSMGRHFFPENKWTACPNFITDGVEECPICDVVHQLYSGGKEAKALAKEMGVRKQFWMNVIVRGKRHKDGTRDEDTGPFIFTPGAMIFQALMSMINDPDYGEALYSVEAGYDLAIERTGSGLETKYTVVPRPKLTPLAADDETIQDILSKAQDLAPVALSEDPDEDEGLKEGHAIWYLPAQRIIDEFDLDNVDNLTADDYSQQAAEEKPRHKPAERQQAKAQKRQVVEEEEDEEEVVEEDDDEEELRQSARQSRQARAARRR